MLTQDKRKLTLKSKILLYIYDDPNPTITFQERMRSMQFALFPEYYEEKAKIAAKRNVARLYKKGLIRYKYVGADKLLELTEKGVLEMLFEKAKLPSAKKLDDKWSLVLFDIPEKARSSRERLRRLLTKCGFKALQASVYISPYDINDDTKKYLQLSKLIQYIRIMRVDKIDNDIDIRKAFKNLI